MNPSDVPAAAAARFGLRPPLQSLPGERTLNVRCDGGVLKLHDPDDRDDIALEAAALGHLDGLGGRVPRALATDEGTLVVDVATDGGPRLARALSWLDGHTWGDPPRAPTALAELGRLVAEVDARLASFDHPHAGRFHRWNLLSAPQARPLLDLVGEPDRRAVAAAALAGYDEAVASRLAALPHQVIHNDANSANIVLDGAGHVSGLIDFGDLCRAPRICGLAVAATYAMVDRVVARPDIDPVRGVLPLIAGYHAVAPLTPAELELLVPLVRTRLAISICMAWSQSADDPDNAYLLVSQRGVWGLLQRLTPDGDHLALCRLRDAVGYEPDPSSRAVRSFLATATPSPVLGTALADLPRAVLDWSAGTTEPPGGVVAIGRWGEDRAVYTQPAFEGVDGDGEPEARTVHLAVDLFAPPGTRVHAPLDGVVHAVHDNAAPLDYGPVVILRHALDDGSSGAGFFTLYGHLSRASIAGVVAGQRLRAGDVVAAIGDRHENGGWAPHVHVQVLTHLLGRGVDVPGVAPRSELAVWRSVSPDPNLLLGLPEGTAAPRHPLSGNEIARRRATSMSPALSLSYAEPLHIVRGHGAYLVDTGGREWLDLVNNVAHVGHAHPRVVAAAAAQQAILNTNTRYLHSMVVEYARRLVATLPDPLSVCFFVNSGSEANDLALRLAYTSTGARDVLVLDHAYHGHLVSLIDVSPYKFNGRGGLGAPPTTHVVPMPDPYRGRYRTQQGEPSASVTPAYLAEVDSLLDGVTASGRRVAAFLSEPMPGTAGQVVLADGFLAGAYERVRAAGGICIADEVQIGFGRPGTHLWGFEAHGVVPDVVTMGKPIGNGHPLGAVVTTPEVAHSFLTGMEYFNTFGGNPVSAAVGLAVLDVIADERLQARALHLGARLLDGLRSVGERHRAVGDVRGTGLFLGVELVDDPDARTPSGATASAVVEAVKRRGVLLSSDGPDHNVLKLKPPMVLTAQDCDRVVQAVDEALAEVAGPGPSPGQ